VIGAQAARPSSVDVPDRVDGFWAATSRLAEARRWHRLGEPVRAAQACRQILHFEPEHPDALHLLGILLRAGGRAESALAQLCLAVTVNPLIADYHLELGHIYRDLSMPDKALESYRAAYALRPDPGLLVLMSLLLPIVPRSRHHLLRWRAGLERRFDSLLRDRVVLDDPLTQVPRTAFLLAYHGLSDRRLQETLARFYLTACPALAWTAPHCQPGRSRVRGRYRVGFASSYFRFHTIAKVTRGIIERLDRRRFHVTVFLHGAADSWSHEIGASADRSVQLAGSLAEMRDAIARERLDLLLYPDIGMSPATYFLAFARLAPVQCVTWGHPVTTGIAALDYYISSAALEPPGSEAEYSERLVRLECLPTYYHRPAVPSDEIGRRRFGLEEGPRLYACPQLLFKLHPDFDQVLGEILRRDPNSRVVLVGDTEQRSSPMARALRERFAGVNPDVADRLVILPFLSGEDFIRLLAAVDVLLDPPYFGGGNTTLEALAVGTPIITWPGPFARGRTTFACFRAMGVSDCVVDTLGDYAKRAVEIATDRARRDAIRAEILHRNDVIYENRGAVSELESFFSAAIDDTVERGDQVRSL